MRLVRCVQFAIGMAASGGAVAVLSGSALAADGGSLSTVTQTDSVKTTTSQVSGKASDVVVNNSGGGLANGAGVDAGTGVLQATPVADGIGTKSDGTNVTATTTDGQTTGVATVGANATNVNPGGGVTAGSGASEGPTGGLKTVVAGSANEIPVVAVVTPVAATPASVTPAARLFRTTMLPIQPTITGRGLPAQDLAPTAPSAPGPARAPKPAKSSGMLGGITAELATIVVPQPALVHPVLGGAVVTILNLAVLVGLLLQIFVFTYGLWLRRGGFATAARSDEPSGGSPSSIATPFRLGYVESPPRFHNPVLMGVVTVPNAFRKEDRR